MNVKDIYPLVQVTILSVFDYLYLPKEHITAEVDTIVNNLLKPPNFSHKINNKYFTLIINSDKDLTKLDVKMTLKNTITDKKKIFDYLKLTFEFLAIKINHDTNFSQIHYSHS